MSRRITVIDGDRSREFKSVYDAARQLGMSPHAIIYRLRGGDTIDISKCEVKAYRGNGIRNAVPVKVILTGEGYSVVYDTKKQVAEELGCSVDTVTRRMRDGRSLFDTPFGTVKLRAV